MSSIIPGYEYDIFISYRQKDNKYDGWVTEFVENLRRELEATFKEDISVYFDINPHDGLLETHDVDASLKDKLKCLIFIPIISRTYCDPKSFAWEHEFKAFVEKASQDRFGLKVKLPNGNVASRVLPVRIYDLDTNDIKLCESVLGGVLRSIDFIYKSAGVNRPLNPLDNPHDNLNKTYYRDQINKVANSIKEIITAIGQHIAQKEEVPKEIFKPISVPRKSNKTKIIVGSLILLALIVLSYFFIPILSNPEEQLEKSIAVLPFRNDSPNDSTTYFLNGVMEEILNNLQKISDFSRVLSRTSTEQYRGSTKTSLPKIAKELNVNYLVEGSGQKYGNKFVLRVQLIVASNEKHLWGKSYEKEIQTASDQISIQSEIAQAIASELKVSITPDEKQLINKVPTTNLTALDFYQRGRDEHIKYWSNYDNTKALKSAISYYKLALKSDSTFAQAYTSLAIARANYYWRDVWTKLIFSENEMKIVRDSILSLVDKGLSYNNKLDEAYFVRGLCSENHDVAIKEYKKALEINPNYSLAYKAISDIFFYNKNESLDGVKNLLKAIELERGPLLPAFLDVLGEYYEELGFNENAIDIYNHIFQLTNDTLQYFQNMSGPYWASQNWEESIRWAKKILENDSNYYWAHFQLASIYLFLGKDDLFSYHAKRSGDLNSAAFDIEINKGIALWRRGDKMKANAIFDKVVDFSIKLIKSNADINIKDYYIVNLARIFSLKDEQKKAMEYLNMISINMLKQNWFIVTTGNDPCFNNIRSNERFKEILNTAKSSYQKEHEKVRIWLEQNNLLKI